MDLRRKRQRLSGFDYSDPQHVYFVTLCARHQRRPFSDQALAGRVVDSILRRITRGDWQVYAYCLMPDHLHMAVSPAPGGGSLSYLLQGFKSYTTRLAWKRGCKGPLWQRSYYDHIARKEEDVLGVCLYILGNPVRKGLVTEPPLWPYSGMPDPVPG